jgi:hypothetical protein
MHHEFELCLYVYYYISIVIHNETNTDKSSTKYLSMFHILRSCMTSNRELRKQAWAQTINEKCIGTKKSILKYHYRSKLKTQSIYVCQA